MEPLDTAQELLGHDFPQAVAAFLGGSVLTPYRTTTSDLDIVVILPLSMITEFPRGPDQVFPQV